MSNRKWITPEQYATAKGCKATYIQRLVKIKDYKRLPYVSNIKNHGRFYLLEVPVSFKKFSAKTKKKRVLKSTMRKKVGKIEKRIPIPKVAKGCKSAVYPFLEMKVGDSFLVKGYTSSRMSSAATAWARYRKSKMKFTVRGVAGGARVWRIK